MAKGKPALYILIMQQNNCLRIALLLLIFLCSNTLAKAQNIDIQFSGIRSARGQVIVKIYTDDKSFDDNKPIKTVKFPKHDLANGKMAAQLTLPPGTYGFALLDDENGDSKMEYSLLHMPKEGFAFSNFYLTGMKSPHFSQFKFTLQAGQKLHIDMRLRYL